MLVIWLATDWLTTRLDFLLWVAIMSPLAFSILVMK